jgi:hypothetical protein
MTTQGYMTQCDQMKALSYILRLQAGRSIGQRLATEFACHFAYTFLYGLCKRTGRDAGAA